MAETVYRVEAENLSKASENRIHDDTVAQRFGFSGGLVPGVEVYAYATHAMIATWGREWLERGFATCRFLKPVYDETLVTVTGRMAGERLAITLESDGVLCATAEAAAHHGEVAPDLGEFAWRPLPAIDARPAADEVSLAPGLWLGTPSLQTSAAMLAEYLRGGARGGRVLCGRGDHPSRHGAALLQPGADGERRPRAVDSHGQHGAEFRHRARGRRAVGARAGGWQPGAEGAPVRRPGRAGGCE